MPSLRRLFFMSTAVAVIVLALVPAALAYDETGSGRTCVECHGTEAADEMNGPHGGYTTTTSKCATCHSVHAAPAGGVLLLPAATIKGTCEVCHDGTGGKGVYGTVKARTGNDPVADHSIGVTNIIPGGDASTGGSATRVFSDSAGNLTCSDCHSPHGASVVASFTGDRSRSTTMSGEYASTRLLRQAPTGAATPTAVYGSDWCAGCHAGRLSGGSAHNHPVESSSTAGSGAFHYDSVQRVTGVGASTTTTGTLGRNNLGYVMPYPRTSRQSGHDPICQQCHEDARNVGDTTFGTIEVGETFTTGTVDGITGGSPGGNPQFHTFPHESQNTRMLVETDDDLCLNCHESSEQLP